MSDIRYYYVPYPSDVQNQDKTSMTVCLRHAAQKCGKIDLAKAIKRHVWSLGTEERAPEILKTLVAIAAYEKKLMTDVSSMTPVEYAFTGNELLEILQQIPGNRVNLYGFYRRAYLAGGVYDIAFNARRAFIPPKDIIDILEKEDEAFANCIDIARHYCASRVGRLLINHNVEDWETAVNITGCFGSGWSFGGIGFMSILVKEDEKITIIADETGLEIKKGDDNND